MAPPFFCNLDPACSRVKISLDIKRDEGPLSEETYAYFFQIASHFCLYADSR